MLGLRMSQFYDEKNGALSDPMQKTLSNFVVSGDSCRQSKDNNSIALDSEIRDDNLAVDRGFDCPADNYDTCELRDSRSDNHGFDFNHSDYLLLHNDVETEGSCDFGNNNFTEKVC